MVGFSLSTPARSIFGRDTRHQAASEIAALGHRVVLVRGRSVAWVDELIQSLTAMGVAVETIFSRAEPDLDAARAGVAAARAFAADCVVAVGGGAAIDLGKALAGLIPSEGDPADYLEVINENPRTLSEPLPFVAMPTTSGTGAEATRNAVISVPERQIKVSLRDPRLLPALTVVDPALTDGTPKGVTLATGLDAITQLIESYLCIRANPVTDAFCRCAIPPAIAALNRLMQAEDPAARDAMARASYLSGLALANSGLGIVHGLAAVIGGRGGAHGAICGRLLPDALRINRAAVVEQSGATDRFDEVAGWLAEGLSAPNSDGIAALRRFIDANGLPGLGDFHLPEADFAEVAEAARHASSTKGNPVTLRADQIEAILRAAG